MKTIMIVLSSLMLSLGVAMAQAHVDDPFLQRAAATDLRASSLLGATVYVTQTPATATVVDGPMEAWEDVGNVDEFVASPDGHIRGVIVDVGGFLGIGAHTVMVDMDAVQLVHERDSDTIFVVLTTTREALENAPAFDGDTIGSQARSDFAGRVGVPDMPADGFEAVAPSALTVDDLTGATVYDRHGDRVSGISDVVLSPGGDEVEAVLIDVGGFLGLFTRTVAVDMDQLQILADAESGDIRVYLDMSEEELEDLPEHEG